MSSARPDKLLDEIGQIEAEVKQLQTQLANLEADIKDNAHYKEEAVINLDRAELAEFQLAWCREELEKIACLGDGNTRGNSEGNCLAIELIESLPKSAALDVEILKAAKEWAKDKACMSDKYLDPEDVVLRNVVRARKEAENDN